MGTNFERKIVTTADGSHSLELVGLGEHYHSTFGAVQESRYVFIRNGLLSLSPKESLLKILEVGFGTGLNAYLTLMESRSLDQPLYYYTLEPFPLVKEEFERLNYPGILEEGQQAQNFLNFHQCGWEEDVKILKDFVFHKSRAGLVEANLPADSFDLVFFDAFGPDTQPELWELPVFEKVFRTMRPGGILVTYSAKGAVRRALKGCGFKVDKLAGPPGKREMTRAMKPLN